MTDGVTRERRYTPGRVAGRSECCFNYEEQGSKAVEGVLTERKKLEEKAQRRRLGFGFSLLKIMIQRI